MNGKKDKVWLLAAMLIVMLCGGVPWAVMRAAPAAHEVARLDATKQKVLHYIAERFGVPDTIKLSLTDLHTSAVAPGFDEGEVVAAEGGSDRKQTVLVSKDARYLILVKGTIIDLQQDSPVVMAKRIREIFHTPDTQKLLVGGFRNSPAPDFKLGTLTVDDGRDPKQEFPVLLTRDGKHLIVSELYSMNVDPREQALRIIKLHDEPSQGPVNAPVTIVEFADLECPSCARVQEFLEDTLLPRYGNKVRVVFKEFPLPMHDWSMTAAIANQCAYELDPAAYVPMRTAIFRSQQFLNIANVRQAVLNFGEQAGVNRVQLAGCLDAKSSLPRIERDVEEGKRLDVNQTPTLYINGRMMIGLPSEQAYFQLIDDLLRGK